MTSVTQQTGVPPDTLRSWERRHGFPVPTRNDSNRRLYSERDIAAIAWVRDQTERGQGTSEAIAMLSPYLAGPVVEATAVPMAPAPFTDATGIDHLVDVLLDGAPDRAQRAWDRLALAVSIDALCADVILPAHRALQDAGRDISRSTMLQAVAFLHRKATTLLDHAGPDAGDPTVCLVTAGGEVPALALATVLARAGVRVITPILDAASIDALALVREMQPAMTIIITDARGNAQDVASFAALLNGTPLAVWAPDELDRDALPPALRRLPTSPRDVSRTLRREA